MTEQELRASEEKVKRGRKLLAEHQQWREILDRINGSNAIMLATLNSGFQMATYSAHGSLDWDKAKDFLGFEVPVGSLGIDVRDRLLLKIREKMRTLKQEFDLL